MELSKSKLALFSSLRSSKLRRKNGMFTVEGLKSVMDTIGSFETVAIVKLQDLKLDFGTDVSPIYTVTADEMKKLSALSSPSSVMAVYRIPDNSKLDLKVNDGLYVVLDGIQDPGNLGTIIRTCHWFGIKRIFASKDTVDVFNPKCVQSSMGSLASVRVDYCNLLDLFEVNPSIPVYGTMLEGNDIFSMQFESRGFIVMGNEGKGLSQEIRQKIDIPLFIPPKDVNDHSESLNVAVATAIVISQIVK